MSTGRAEVLALRALLLALGVLMSVASRFSDRFRRQITRDLVIEVSSADGARQAYALHRATRRLTLPRRPVTPDAALRFATAREALVTLLSPRRVGRIVEGMNSGRTRIDGNAVLILWFHGLTRVVAPIGRSRRPRHEVPAPPRAPEPTSGYAHLITREPAVAELDRAWTAGWQARAALLQLRGPDGDRLPPG